MSDAGLSATLAGIKERAEGAAPALAVRRGLNNMADSAEDVPSLAAAVEAALKLAGEWERDARILDARAASAGDGEHVTAAGLTGRAQAKKDAAGELRTRITAALTGEETGDGH